MNKLISVSILMAGLGASVAHAQAPGQAGPNPASLATATAPAAETDRPMAPPAVAAPPIGPNAPAFTLGDGPPLPARPFSMTKSDPALDEIISPKAKLELVDDHFGLTEGPVWVPEGKSGYILIVDMLANAIYKITPDNKVSLWMYKAGYSGKDLLHAGIQTRRGRVNTLLIGPECLSRDSQGRVVWCASNDGAVMRLEKDGTTRTIIANNYEGKRFSGPNDLTIKANDSIFFTDVDTGLRDGKLSPLKQLPFTGIFLIKNEKVTLLLDEKQLGGGPNGIALSPDGKWLYASSGGKKLMRYEVKDDDTLGAGSVFGEGDGIGDGIKVDIKGRVYSTGGAGPGEIRIQAPDGKLLGMLHLPLWDTEPKREICALNIAFGDADGKTMYIAAGEAVFKIRVKTAGLQPGPPAN
ncbi:MAG: SMP-30/gluconolactonase/LRE family protein [Gammaproteobacteria bacterium]